MPSVVVQVPFNKYIANGTATVYPYEFQLPLAADLIVTLDGVETLDYTLTGIGLQDGGTVKFAVAPANGVTVLVRRSIELERDTDYQYSGDFREDTVDRDFNRLWWALQDVSEILGRTLKLPVGFPAGFQLDAPGYGLPLRYKLDGSGVEPYTPQDVVGNPTLQTSLLDGTNASKGAGQVGYGARTAYLAGSVGRALRDRGVSPCDYPYLAKGDDTTDDTVAITLCLAENKHVDFGDASKKYKVTAEIPLQDDQYLTGTFAQIRQATANKVIFTHDGTGMARSRGITYVGTGNYLATDMSRETAFRCTGGGRIEVIGNRFINFGYTSVHGIGCASFFFDLNYVEGPGAPTLTPVSSGQNYGVLADVNCRNVHIGDGNEICKHAQGVRIGDRCDTVYIGSMSIHDIVGQHGIYGGAGCTNVRVVGTSIRDVSLIGCKWQNDDATPYDAQNIKFIGVQVADSGSHGFQMTNGTGSVQKMRGAEMIGCTSVRAGEDGFNLSLLVDGLLVDCVADTPTREGFSWSNCPGIRIINPIARYYGANGMRDLVASPHTQIINPTLIDGATSNTVGQRFGIFIADCTEYTIKGARIRDANANMEYGIYLIAGTLSTCTFVDNKVLNATGTAVRFPTGTFREYHDNYYVGTGGPVTNEPVIPTATIVSNVLTIPQGCKACYVPAGTITSITVGGHSGKTIALIYTGITTMTDGGNIKGPAANFVSTADDVQLMTCDGPNYYQGATGSVN